MYCPLKRSQVKKKIFKFVHRIYDIIFINSSSVSNCANQHNSSKSDVELATKVLLNGTHVCYFSERHAFISEPFLALFLSHQSSSTHNCYLIAGYGVHSPHSRTLDVCRPFHHQLHWLTSVHPVVTQTVIYNYTHSRDYASMSSSLES